MKTTKEKFDEIKDLKFLSTHGRRPSKKQLYLSKDLHEIIMKRINEMPEGSECRSLCEGFLDSVEVVVTPNHL